MVTSLTVPGSGTAQILGGNALVRYTPTTGTRGVDRFDYTASDGHGGTGTGTVFVTVVSPSFEVRADAGADAVVVFPNGVELRGRASLPETALTVAWEKISGSGNVVFQNASKLITEAVFSSAGTYTLRLTAQCNGVIVSQDSDEVRVFVQPQVPATTLYVDDGAGSDAFDGLSSVPSGNTQGPKKTLQAALDSAGDDSLILVAAGFYPGDKNTNLSFAGKRLWLRAASGPEVTVIDV